MPIQLKPKPKQPVIEAPQIEKFAEEEEEEEFTAKQTNILNTKMSKSDSDDEQPQIQFEEPASSKKSLKYNLKNQYLDQEDFYPKSFTPVYSDRSGGRKQMGMAEMKPFFNMVSSGKARDIVRKKHFMADTPFQNWRSKDEARQAYDAGLIDYDGDGIANEFVVRKKLKDGSLTDVAVNGYTTKRSDFPLQYQYLNQYPTREARSGGNNIKLYAKNLYDAKYLDDHMTIDKDKLNATMAKDDMKYLRGAMDNGYDIKKPKDLSPYQIFGKYVIHPAIKEAIHLAAHSDDVDDLKAYRKQLVQTYGFGFAASLLSQFYWVYVLEPSLRRVAAMNPDWFKTQIGKFEVWVREHTDNKQYQYTDTTANNTELAHFLAKNKGFKSYIKQTVAKFVTLENWKTYVNEFSLVIKNMF
jgi:hypothetical protein